MVLVRCATTLSALYHLGTDLCQLAVPSALFGKRPNTSAYNRSRYSVRNVGPAAYCLRWLPQISLHRMVRDMECSPAGWPRWVVSGATHNFLPPDNFHYYLHPNNEMWTVYFPLHYPINHSSNISRCFPGAVTTYLKTLFVIDRHDGYASWPRGWARRTWNLWIIPMLLLGVVVQCRHICLWGQYVCKNVGQGTGMLTSDGNFLRQYPVEKARGIGLQHISILNWRNNITPAHDCNQ